MPKQRGYVVTGVAWLCAATLGIATLAWPHIGGAVLLSDDAQLLFAHLPDPRYFHGWDSPTGFFRPIEILSAHLVDPETRDARTSLLLHLPAVAALLGAMLFVLRRTTRRWRLAFPLAITWWVLSVTTAIAIWQPDTISQAWSGAAGAWTAILAWVGIDRARAGRLSTGHIVAFVALCIAGVFTKEFYVGWAAGTVAVVAIAFVSSSAHQRAHRMQWLALSTPPAAVALAFIVLRLTTGALSLGTGGDRYDVALGLNVVENVAITTAGFLAVGPSHLTTAGDASILARIAAPAGAGLTAAFLGAGLIRLVRRRRSADWSLPVYGGILAFAAVGPAIVTHHVSEYYLFGPSAIVACFVGVTLAWLLTRAWTVPAALLVLALAGTWGGIGLFGAYARADAIGVHWTQVALIDQHVRDVLASAPPREPIRISFPAWMAEGTRHGVFRSTPTHLYDLPLTARFFSEYSGEREVVLVVGHPEPPRGVRQFTVDVDLPR